MTSDPISTELIDQVLVITLDRPDVLNAFSGEMGRQLSDALRSADADDDVRVVVVTGAGRAFCAGADFSGGAAVFGAPSDRGDFRSDPLTFHPWDVRKPTIAAINGPAIGLGLTLTLQFDIRVVADNAKLGIVQVRRGVMPDLHSHWTLPRLIGHARATELLLTGRRFTGAEAAEWGLANRAVPADQVLESALELAHELAKHTAPVSAGVSKRLLWWNPQPDADRIDDLERDLHLHLMGGPDAKEGVLAWTERRDPEWSWTVSENWPDWLGDDGTPRP
ncbi:MAG: enoyl-CoA hydratase/isomerase family protein [Acidimicrobiales bacterium]